jgi:enoyl-CoA hydratase
VTKINCEIDNEIAIIKMDDGKVNAMDDVFFEEFGESLDRVETNNTKALIFTGRPGFFSGGLDLKHLSTLQPKNLSKFYETFALTLLRVFSLPIPTIAACTGHAIAGGAMLCFACDRRFIIDGNYKIQINEVLIGIPLPSFMLLIGSSAIPQQWRNEALLHAKAYNPEEIVARNIFDAVVEEGDDVVAYAKSKAEKLLALKLPAYATTKKRMRSSSIEEVKILLKDELF